MVQLQRDITKFKDAGVQIVGLSPDAVDKLKQFSKQKSISFPLLSDTDGTAIKALGLENKEARKFLPHPGILIIDTEGVVQSKLFKEGFKTRHDSEAILKAADKITVAKKPAGSGAKVPATP